MKQTRKSVIQAQGTFIIREINTIRQALPIVIDLDERIHTDDNPQCDDPTCPCNANTVEADEEYPIVPPARQYEDWQDYL